VKISKVFIKHIFFITSLLLVGFANIYAKDNNNTSSLLQNFELQNKSISIKDLDCSVFSPYHKERRNLPTSEVIEIENTEENEEISSKENYKTTSDNYLSTVFYKSSLQELAYSHQQNSTFYSLSFKNTSLKLHIKFQVFII